MRRLVVVVLSVSACTVGSAGPGTDPDGSPGVDVPAGAARLRVTATTSPTAGPATYAPRNITAVWIEDAAGTFIKTIDRQANVRKASLIGWIAKAGNADVDAVTGATRPNHNVDLSITWDLEDKTGTVIGDGTYTVRMESADENAATQADNNEATFTFVKGPTAQNQTGLSNGGFSAVTLDFVP